MQLHFGTFRNVNTAAFNKIGKDSGFDVFRASVDTDALARLLDKMHTRLGDLPKIILYPLNDECLRAVCAISGAFPNVIVGAAWWFNDTVSGIKRQLETVSEYAVLGTNLGMLTDSRSFSSYVRFDFTEGYFHRLSQIRSTTASMTKSPRSRLQKILHTTT